MSGHTRGPWSVQIASGALVIFGESTMPRTLVARVPNKGYPEVAYYDACLIASAPNHALIARALCAGIARWEPFASANAGEFCIGGFRHATQLDEFGVPMMTDGMRTAIAKATRGSE